MAQLIEPEIMAASEIQEKWGINLLLYGPPGVGKTHFIGTAQDLENTQHVLVIDVEGGSRTLSHRDDIKITKPKDWDALQNTFKWLYKGDHPYRTIGIDTITAAQALAMQHVLKKSKNPDLPGIQDFGKCNELMVRMIRCFRSLVQEFGWNVIFTAHVREDKDESTGSFITRPALTPKAGVEICASVDAVGYLTQSKKKRSLRVKPAGGCIAKLRVPGGNNDLPDIIEQPTVAALFKIMNQGETNGN